VLWAPALHSQLESLDASGAEAVEWFWSPPAEKVREDIALYRGAYADQVLHRLGEFGDSPAKDEAGQAAPLMMALEALCRALGMMLAGMALFRWGVFSARRSAAFHRRMMLIGFGLGLPLAAWGLQQYHARDFHFAWSLSLGRAPNHLATLFMAAGYVGLVMLWSRSSILVTLRRRTAAVGRMAFSNYLGQTLLATALFQGWGMGLYARLGRLELAGVMAAIWVLQLFFSPWWLERFRMGPMEWLWRSLTYFRPQSLRR